MRHAGQILEIATTETERGLQEAIIEYARWHHWRVYHAWLSAHSAPGYPDLTLCRGERLVVAEVKNQRGKVTPDQDAWLRALAAVPGVETYVWKPVDWPEIERVLA